MPKNKDLKRLVRARMAKTGESYTTARAHIVESEGVTDATPEALPLPADYEKLASTSNEAVEKKTGRTWPQWATYLDGRRAYEWDHPAIAAHLAAEFDFGGWWAQTITVGYERFRGLRDVGQRRDGDYDANKSRTVGAPLRDLFHAFSDEDTRSSWLGDVGLDFHRSTPEKSMRGRTADGRGVAVYFTEKGPDKSSVSVQVSGLPDREAVDVEKALWHERLDRLQELLTTA